jgi:hypothetical protein
VDADVVAEIGDLQLIEDQDRPFGLAQGAGVAGDVVERFDGRCFPASAIDSRRLGIVAAPAVVLR